MIIGGDLNFTIATHEIWGPNARVDPLAYFFQNLLQILKLVGLDPHNPKSSWTNRRTGKDRIAKRLYRFMVGGNLLEYDLQFKEWVDSEGDSYHQPIFLKVSRNPQKTACPFKFGATWLNHEEVLELIKSNCTPYGAEVGSNAATHFVQILARVKKLLKEWEKNKKTQDEQALLIFLTQRRGSL